MKAVSFRKAFEYGPVTKSGRVSVLEAFLETPEIVSAMARGSGLTEQQIRGTIQKVIDDLNAQVRSTNAYDAVRTA